MPMVEVPERTEEESGNGCEWGRWPEGGRRRLVIERDIVRSISSISGSLETVFPYSELLSTHIPALVASLLPA